MNWIWCYLDKTLLDFPAADPDAIGPSAAHHANCSVLVLALSTRPCGLDSNQDRGHPQPGMDLSLAKGGPVALTEQSKR